MDDRWPAFSERTLTRLNQAVLGQLERALDGSMGLIKLRNRVVRDQLAHREDVLLSIGRLEGIELDPDDTCRIRIATSCPRDEPSAGYGGSSSSAAMEWHQLGTNGSGEQTKSLAKCPNLRTTTVDMRSHAGERRRP